MEELLVWSADMFVSSKASPPRDPAVTQERERERERGVFFFLRKREW